MTSTVIHPRILALLATLVLVTSAAGGAQLPQAGAGHGPRGRVAVALHAIARGAVLADGDFEYRDTTVHAGADTARIAAGWVTRRTINAGEVLRAPAVEPPNVVAANQPVAVEWTDQNIRLSLRGIATRNAPVGTRISVRMDNGRRVDGTVVGAGRVRID